MASRSKIWGQVVAIGILCCSFKEAACNADHPESAKVGREVFRQTKSQHDLFANAMSQSSFTNQGTTKKRIVVRAETKSVTFRESNSPKTWVAMMEGGSNARLRRSAVAVALARRRLEEDLKAKEAAKRARNSKRHRGAAVMLAAARRRVPIGNRRYQARWERKRRLEHERRVSRKEEEGINRLQGGTRTSSAQGAEGGDEDAESLIYNERDRQPKDQSRHQPEEKDPQFDVSRVNRLGEDGQKLTDNEANATNTRQGVHQSGHRQVEGNGPSEEMRLEENRRLELEEEKQRHLEEERQRQVDEQRRRQLEEETRRNSDEERRRQLDEERRRQLDEERRRKLDEERRRTLDEERRRQLEKVGTGQVEGDKRRREEESRRQLEEKRRRQLEKQRGQNEEVTRILRLEEEAQRQKLMKEKEEHYEKRRSEDNIKGTHDREMPFGGKNEQSENDTRLERNSVSTTSPTSTTARSASQQRSEYEKLIRSRCTDCKVGNQTFRGHSRFSYEEDCHKYQCICHCDGSYDCPAQNKVRVCEQGIEKKRERPACSSCTVEGEIVQGNSMFELQDGCTLFRECKCFCNGTSACSPNQTENTCVPNSQTGSEASQFDSEPNRNCKKCLIEGIEHPSESRFQYTRDCITTDCSCSCNGTIECDQSSAVNRCVSAQPTPQPQLEIQVNKQRVELQDCQKCVVAGRMIDGNSQFNAKVGCYIDTCFCLCNGRYSCIRNWARNICNDDTGFDDGSIDDLRPCRGCFLQGVHYPGNATFKFTTGCTALNCACTCSGTVECYEESAVNICGTRPPSVKPLFEVIATDNVRTPGPQECKKCMINGTQYDGNSQFDLQNGCYTDRCICLCNGKHTCRRYQAQHGCNETESPPKKDLVSCQKCLVQGRQYPGNSTFQTTSGCIVKECRCTCSGSVECDDRTAVNICQTTSVQPKPTTQPTPKEDLCKKCMVDGMDYAGESKFKVKRGCKVYPCHCRCDGRWGCQTDAAVDICKKPSSEPTVSRETCQRCVVQGRKYPGNSEFKLRKGCISFRCTCACDGSWECPPEQARNYCPGSTQSTETTTAATLSPTEPMS